MNDAARRAHESSDFAEYLRVLPKLLKRGETGRVALLEGGKLVSVWDTPADALQAGYDQFGLDAEFLTQPISARDAASADAGPRSPQRPARRRARS